jgi:hypothetical protein
MVSRSLKSRCGLNQFRYLRKMKGHGLLERDGKRYAYRVRDKGNQSRLHTLSQTTLRPTRQQPV